ncbi:DMT family transporter [Bradyrhizobium paxllaeri]|uniref:DMT family transporter n=1 Tax=Bradyrhizobium paxllaeri TaxID=190148 RepID=UPI0008108297|nr:multidrug efflux SMR transporter [Bradyrhizobium paxllaeri]
MNPALVAHGALALAIICEVTGSAFLLRSDGFTKLVPTVAMGLCYLTSFYLLSVALKMIPLGVAYAIWAGLGIVLTAIVGVVVFRQALDLWACVGIGLIVAGVAILNLLSNAVGH